MTWKKKLALGAVVLAVAMQLVPYGRSHENPPAVTKVTWKSAPAQAIFQKACADCHTHETRWPWYSHVAPVSWLVQHDVDEGRREFNLSQLRWNHGKLIHEVEEVVIEKDEMPLKIYTLTHPEAKLTAEERKTLMEGVKTLVLE